MADVDERFGIGLRNPVRRCSGEAGTKRTGRIPRTDDTDTGSAAEGDNIPAVCYITGHFNRGAVAVKAGATIDTYEDELKGIGIHLANVQKYE